MVYERSVVIFTCAVLSTFTSYSNSLATESKVSKSANISDQIIVQLNDRQNISDKQNIATLISSNNQEQAQKKSVQQPKGLKNQGQQRQVQVISQSWSFIGMSLTSVLFLVVIWLLFQPDSRNREQTAVLPIDTFDDHNNINEVADKVELLQQKEIISPEPLPMVVKKKETISPDPLTMIGMEYTNEPIPRFKKIETTIATPAYRTHQNSTNDKIISEPKNKPLQSQVIPLTDKKGRLITPTRSASPNQAEIMSKVTIVKAKTTEIDVVFELIQDLQQSDRSLRRKAIWKLAYIGDFRAIEPLTAIISEANSLDKSLILNTITKIAQRSWQPINQALFISLADENTKVKKNAIRDATAMYKTIFPLTQCLSQMLQDSDLEVQQTAQWALQQFQQQLSLSPVRNQEDGAYKLLRTPQKTALPEGRGQEAEITKSLPARSQELENKK